MPDLLPNSLSVCEAIEKIQSGWLSSVELVQACLDRIDQTDDQLHAWVHIDREGALERAEQMDSLRRSGIAFGRLHGIPVGLKDIIDTAHLPTERGTAIFAGRQTDSDAFIVQRLLEEGAIILGKTVTTELAFVHANETRNPHNPDHSPGGSSSGSAAAVAAHQVPLAIGTQTNGSVIRPAAYCGIVGFKPTNGMISRSGLLQTSRSLDQVGVFARSLQDAALIADVISAYDQADENSFAHPRPALFKGVSEEPPVDPLFATFDLPFADRFSEDVREGFKEVIEFLGDKVDHLPAPPAFAHLLATQATIHQYEFCQHLEDTISEHWDQISDTLQAVLLEGKKITKDQYDYALGTQMETQEFFRAFFKDYDAVLCPSATCEAPKFGDGTGDPACCTIWTLAGLPCVTLPLMTGSSGLPMGLQLIGPSKRDDKLLRTANWLQTEINKE